MSVSDWKTIMDLKCVIFQLERSTTPNRFVRFDVAEHSLDKSGVDTMRFPVLYRVVGSD
ncbi:MAG: hypothetical protein GY866_06250 [Proteobacteria bacterium]|nr:hypothetical protein [Pseudomonadota bacterium]